MKYKKNISCFIIVVAFISLAWFVSSCFRNSDSSSIKIEAASAFYPYTRNLFKSLKETDSELTGSVKLVSTSQAYKDIINGKCDIVVASGPSEEQKEWIENSKDNLEFKALYMEPLVILVNKENKIENISIEEIQRIYNSDDSSWNTYQLEKNNGSQTCFESIVKDNAISKNHFEIDTMPRIVDEIASDEKGIGYAFYSYFPNMYYDDNAKIINVEGKSMEDEEYPLLFDVYLIYRKNSRNDILKVVEMIISRGNYIKSY